ncbi:heme ABC exporter ATP-binding protein CcmA [Pararhizobium sp. IMCC21322]|uniref:heme ABC exporter ATP-binding protein CcmA n=1 Tax=Pararhizobium sp. IMCC21322 TaxID=3067903 RepID=UPI002741F474|nr:heme ABC exporter ATP-binding protein CcmA [Pararhizobium sp. IMCC21322]
MRLNVIDVVLVRGERRVVGPVNFDLSKGQSIAVRGPNGAGKSTLLRALAGLLPVESGTINLAGQEIDDDTPRGEHCHYFGHLDGLKSALSVEENLSFFKQLYGTGSSMLSIEEALQQVALAHTISLPVAYLSAGMRKRVALARLLLNRRPVWLLDEPTSALDTASQERLGVMMGAHLDAGGIIIAATHLPLPGGSETVLNLEPAMADTSLAEEVWL